ncbi:MAG: squalene synthase HpnC [Burkholderiales bacterium]
MGAGHYENFPVASIMLPGRLRRPVIAIYRFARAADDIADEGDAPAEERLAQLVGFARRLDRIASGQPTPDPTFEALAATIREFQLPMALFHDLLSAFSQDVVKSRYRDFAQLLDYCRRSANPIGRMLLRLYGVSAPRDLEQSDAICTALQLINFWQDIAIDYEKGRIYVPQDDLARFGVAEDSLVAHSPSRQALIAYQIERSRAMLESGAPLAARLRGRIGMELGLIVEGGLSIARKLRRLNERGIHARPVLRPHDWATIVARASIRRLRGVIAR